MSRYIDADALGIGKADPNVFEKPEYAEGWNSAIDIINNAPTADVQEVRHGRWDTINSKVTQCSVCRVSRDIRTQVGWNFCPVCGAKMD